MAVKLSRLSKPGNFIKYIPHLIKVIEISEKTGSEILLGDGASPAAIKAAKSGIKNNDSTTMMLLQKIKNMYNTNSAIEVPLILSSLITTNIGTIKLGDIAKPTTGKPNIGYIGELFLFIAYYARFSLRGYVTSADVKSYFNKFINFSYSENIDNYKLSGNIETTSATKNYFNGLINGTYDITEVQTTLESAVSAANNTSKITTWVNTHKKEDRGDIKIKMIGMSQSKTSKADVKIYINDIAEVSVSVKTGKKIKQLGQVGGMTHEKLKKLWELFGISITITENEFNESMDKAQDLNDLIDIVSLYYKNAADQLTDDSWQSADRSSELIRALSDGMSGLSIGNEDGVELVLLEGLTHITFSFKDAHQKISKHTSRLIAKYNKTNIKDIYPSIDITLDNNKILFTIQSRSEMNRNKRYFRNVISPGDAFIEIFRERY